MSDVLEHDSRPGSSGRPPWVRWAALGAIGLLGAVVIAQVGLLSGEQPAANRSPGRVDGLRVVVREGDRLVRYGPRGRETLARLPDGMAPEDRIVAVDVPQPAAAVVGVADGALFRVDLPTGRVSRLGAATRVVGSSAEPGQLFVLVGEGAASRLVAVDAETGIVVEPDPFPGFDGTAGWVPRGSVDGPGLVGMLLSRPAATGQEELAVAWPRRAVVSAAAPALLRLGTTGRLLGVTGGLVLALRDGCPGPGCRIEVMGLNRDGFSARSVHPPVGWSFAGYPLAASYQSLVSVVRPGDSGTLGLARLVPGGRNALLLAGSAGVWPSAGVVDQPDGDVYLTVADRAGSIRVARWSPTVASGVRVLRGLPPLPATAHLVAVRD